MGWQYLGTVDASVSGLLWLHKQTMSRLTVEVAFTLHRTIVPTIWREEGERGREREREREREGGREREKREGERGSERGREREGGRERREREREGVREGEEGERIF